MWFLPLPFQNLGGGEGVALLLFYEDLKAAYSTEPVWNSAWAPE